MPLFVCAKSAWFEYVEPRTFGTKTNVVEFRRKQVVVFGVAVVDPCTLRRPLLSRVCLAGIVVCDVVYSELPVLPVSSPGNKELGQKIREKIGRVWAAVPDTPQSDRIMYENLRWFVRRKNSVDTASLFPVSSKRGP